MADVKTKYISPEGGNSIADAEPSSDDLSPGVQEQVPGKVYKCRFIGVAHLAFLNIIVSWDVSYSRPCSCRESNRASGLHTQQCQSHRRISSVSV